MTRRVSLIGGSISFAFLVFLNALGSCQAGGEELSVGPGQASRPDPVESVGVYQAPSTGQRPVDGSASFSNSATERIVIRRPS